MSPREVIARAIYERNNFCRKFDSQPIFVRESYLKIADAVIDALEKMEVTGKMWGAGYSASAEHAVDEERVIEEIWRAMIGAMKHE